MFLMRHSPPPREPPSTGVAGGGEAVPRRAPSGGASTRAAVSTRGRGRPDDRAASSRTPLAGHYGPAALAARSRVLVAATGAQGPRRGVETGRRKRSTGTGFGKIRVGRRSCQALGQDLPGHRRPTSPRPGGYKRRNHPLFDNLAIPPRSLGGISRACVATSPWCACGRRLLARRPCLP